MAEGDYVEPLTGEEIINDACVQLAEHLRRDCNLRDTDSYEGGYSFKFKGTLKLYGMDTTTVEVDVAAGKEQSGEHVYEGPDTVIEAEFEIPQEPALNLVRERSEQPVPTVTTLENGQQEIRQRRYVRREKVAAGGATGENL
jgi:hypothetical protein